MVAISILNKDCLHQKNESKDAFQDDGETGIIIEHDRSVTVKQTIGRGKNKREEVFWYRVHSMFDKFSNKWWPSLDKKIMDQVPIYR